MTRFTLSERAACKLVGLARTTYRYQPKKRDEESLVTRLKELAMAVFFKIVVTIFASSSLFCLGLFFRVQCDWANRLAVSNRT